MPVYNINLDKYVPFSEKDRLPNGLFYGKKSNNKNIHPDTGRKFDKHGLDKFGFDRNGTNVLTASKYTPEGFDRWGFDKDGYDIGGFNRDGINRETGELYDTNGFDKFRINRFGIKEGTQNEDPMVKFARIFIREQLSIEEFAARRKITEEQLRERMAIICNIACVKDELDKLLNRDSKAYTAERVAEKMKLLNDECDITDVSDIDRIFSLCTPEEKVEIVKKLCEGAARGTISISEYKRIWNIRENDKSVAEKIKGRIVGLRRETVLKSNTYTKEDEVALSYEEQRIDKYIPVYIKGDIKRIGYNKDGKQTFIDISPEQEAVALEYITDIGEYVCQYTVTRVIKSIATGQITAEDIQKARLKKSIVDDQVALANICVNIDGLSQSKDIDCAERGVSDE